MTDSCVFPEPDCWHIARSNEKRPESFVARMRFHQSWYRAKVLGCRPGPNPNAGNRRYGNCLNAEDGAVGKNFLAQEIFELAKDRYTRTRDSRQTARLFNNLLSSEPLCFNLFGPLRLNKTLATMLLRVLPGFPDDAIIAEVRFEEAPSPKADYLNDLTAFDCLIEYERPSGRHGLIGIETKLTEPFSQKEYEFTERYSRWMAATDWWWKRGAEQYFGDMAFNQLWRNHLLVYSVLRQPTPLYQEGFCAVVYPREDAQCGDALKTYRTLLTENGSATLLDWPLDSLVSNWEHTVAREKEHDWLVQFRQRYLDLSESQSDWERYVQGYQEKSKPKAH